MSAKTLVYRSKEDAPQREWEPWRYAVQIRYYDLLIRGRLGFAPIFTATSYPTLLGLHIPDDQAELGRAAERLKPGGHVVVLSPAHQWLFTPFDAAIGHCRRYTKKTLAALTPESLELRRSFYLDAVGLLASLGNRLVLKAAMPTPRQIAVWDRVLVRLSRMIDPLLGYSAGKSVVASSR